ncbi:MAG: potassium/proton antiporter [Mucinivorans sp.]
MVVDAGNILFVGSILLFASVVASKASYRFGLPALLIFLGVGMLFGSDGLGIQFSNPANAQFIGVVALSIILFSGGMDTKISEIRPILGRGIMLSTVGVVLTMLTVGGFIYMISQLIDGFVTFSLAESMLLAAVISSTDSASVFSILKAQKLGLKNRLGPLLELESGSNDPMAYMLTILIIEMITANSISVGSAALMFVIQMSVGGLAGWLLGKLGLRVLGKLNIDNKSLYSVMMLAFAFFIFSFTDLLQGNGYLAVYIAGVTIGNGKLPNRREITTFFDGFAWLFQIVMFLALGLLVNPHELWDVVIIGLVVAVFLIVVARPVAVFLSLSPWGRSISTRSKIFVSWVGLRGAVPIIFATYPLLAGVNNANHIFNIVFFITILSLAIQGTTVGYVAHKLGLGVKSHERSFDIDLPDYIAASLTEMEIQKSMLIDGLMIKDVDIPKSSRAVLIERDEKFFVPRGSTTLHVGDKVLIISGKNPTEKSPTDSQQK